MSALSPVLWAGEGGVLAGQTVDLPGWSDA